MRLPRADWDTYFMVVAHVVATRATCDRGPELVFDPGRHGTGAVLVRNNSIIATGYNGSPPGWDHCDEAGHEMEAGHCVRTLHAEDNVMLQCAREGVSTEGATLYATTAPCYQCMKRLASAGIVRIVYATAYGDTERVRALAAQHGIESYQWEPPPGVSLAGG